MGRTLVASLAIVALASGFWFASAGRGSANHAWGPYHWARESSPLTLAVIDSTTSGWDAYRAKAQDDWSASAVLDLTGVSGASDTRTRQRCAVSTGRIRVCNAGYGQTGWLGIATIWLDLDNHIIGGTVKNNDTYFNQPGYNTPAWRQAVICQEIGHTFGLAHQDEDFYNADLLDAAGVASCMDYSANPSENRQPNAHDYEQLLAIYGHLEGGTAAGAGTPSSPGATPGARPARSAPLPDIEGDAEDALPAGAHRGMGSHFERRSPSGLRVVSEVIWIDERPGATPSATPSPRPDPRPRGRDQD